MKKLKKLIIFSAAAVLLLPLLTSCSVSGSDSSDNQARLTLLENRIAALQSSNSALEEKQKEDRLAMESMQKELDSLIESVAAAPEDAPETESSVYFGFSYLLEGENAVITAYTGDTEELIIPASILGHPVTAIADEAFKGSAAKSVSIPETVESIGWFAFASCTRLERIVIPKKVSVIGYGAFDGSPLLKVYAPADSYAAKYAKSYGIPVASD